MTFPIPIYGTKNVPNHQPDIHLSLELHLQVGMCGVGKHEELAANQSHAPWVSQQEYGVKSKNVALGMWGFTQRRLRIEQENIGAGNENHRCQKRGEHVGTEVTNTTSPAPPG